MTVVSYHSTLINDFASQEEAADKRLPRYFYLGALPVQKLNKQLQLQRPDHPPQPS